MESVIEVDRLRKSFGQQQVLNGISLNVGEAETVAVLGRSGTGKSVLLRVLIGLQGPDGGAVRICGEQVDRADARRLNELRKKIGFLFQQGALYDSLTVAENVAFPLERHTRMNQTERRRRVRDLLASVGMEHDLDKFPAQLSGGMQKRVGLARALALDPDVLLFDEPTAGLDPITSGEIDRLIIQLKRDRKLTALVVTHDIPGARNFADRLVLMRDGRIVVEGTFEDLENSRDEFVHEFLRRDAALQSRSEEPKQ